MVENKRWSSLYPQNICSEIEVPDIGIPDLLDSTAKEHPDQPALSFYGRLFSYRQVDTLSHRFAAALQNCGVKKGDRVALMLPNCPQYVIAYYGTLRLGAIVTQVNPMLVEREIEYILNDSGALTIVVYDALYERVAAVRERTALKNVITVSLSETEVNLPAAHSFTSFMQTGSETYHPALIDPDEDIAVLQYTGGTTGRSKGAMLTHRNLVANLMQIHEFFKNEIRPGQEKYLTIIPLFHVFGMTSGMNLAILNGSVNILLPRFQVEEVLETIKREQPTVFPGVPTMYIALINHPKAESYQIGSIRICNSGSAPMPVELMKDFERKTGASILEGYGLSEASPTTHCTPPFAANKPGSVGIGLPSTDYKVVDIATGTTEVPVGEMGELIIKGPQVMKGYWNLPEETNVALRDGWLYTGDIARMDEQGYVYIVDRKKDMIIASGYNIYPRDVEEVLYEHPGIHEAVVVGVPDPYRGETVKAVLVSKEGACPTEEEIVSYCRERLASYKVPTLIEFREALPKTSVGKVLRRAIKEEHRNEAT